MKLHTLQQNARKKKKTVGRGGRRGKTSGRGTKGQKARAGHRIRPAIRDVIKKLPKLRGRGKNINKAFRVAPVIVKLGAIDRLFTTAGASVTPETLASFSLIRVRGKIMPRVKVVGTGSISKALVFSRCTFSKEALKKIETAGGSVK